MLRFSPCSTDLFTLSELFFSLFFFLHFTLMTLGLVRWTWHRAQSEFFRLWISFFFSLSFRWACFLKGPKDDLNSLPRLIRPCREIRVLVRSEQVSFGTQYTCQCYSIWSPFIQSFFLQSRRLMTLFLGVLIHFTLDSNVSMQSPFPFYIRLARWNVPLHSQFPP